MTFLNANDIAYEYGMSVPTTRRHMAKMRKLFEIDEKRLPKKCMLQKNCYSILSGGQEDKE